MSGYRETIKKWFRGLKVRFQDEAGIGLVESLAAVALLGIAGTAFVLSLSTGAIAVRENDQEVVAQSLARAQLEYIKNYPYNPGATTYPYVDSYDETYNPSPITLPEGYGIGVVVSPIPEAGGDTDIQKIAVTISREGVDLLTVAGYKVKR
jgi:type II secretory pathway pseudopilin PulG